MMQNNNSLEYYILKSLIIIEYLIILIIGYFLSLKQGNFGIAVNGLMGQNDSFFYYNQILTNLTFGTDLNPTGTYFVPMMTFLGNIFHTESIFLLKIFNFMGFLLMISAVGLLVKQVSDNLQTTVHILKRFVLFPSMMLTISIPFGRDGWIYLFFFLSVYFLLKLQDSRNDLRYLAGFSISLYLLFGFREYAGASIIIGLFIYFAFRYIKKKGILLLSLLVIFSIWFEFFSSVKLPIIDLSLKDALTFQSGQHLNQSGFLVDQRTGASDFMGSFDSNNIIVFLLQVTFSYLGNLIGPFIWQLKSIPMLIIAVFESIPMIVLIFSLLKQYKSFNDFLSSHPKYIMLLSQSFAWLSMIALTNKNIGTGLRLKIPVFIFIWIVYYGFKTERNKTNGL